jgi:hypothetical protein
VHTIAADALIADTARNAASAAALVSALPNNFKRSLPPSKTLPARQIRFDIIVPPKDREKYAIQAGKTGTLSASRR